jgi:hypothetical protein
MPLDLIDRPWPQFRSHLLSSVSRLLRTDSQFVIRPDLLHSFLKVRLCLKEFKAIGCVFDDVLFVAVQRMLKNKDAVFKLLG